MELKIQNLDKLLTLQGCSLEKFLIDDYSDRYHLSFENKDYDGHFILIIFKLITDGKVAVNMTWEKPPHNYPYPTTSLSLNEINTLTKFCDRIDTLCRTNIYNI